MHPSRDGHSDEPAPPPGRAGESDPRDWPAHLESEPSALGPSGPIGARPQAWATAARWALRGILTLGVTWILVRSIGVTFEEAVSFQGFDEAVAPLLLLLSSFVLLCGFVVSGGLWGRLVARLGGRDPGFVAAARIVLAANLARYLPGRIWHLAGLGILARREGIPLALGVGAGVLGQAFALMAAIALAAPMLVGRGWAAEPSGLLFILVCVLGMVILSLPSTVPWGIAVVSRVTRTPIPPMRATGWGFGPAWFLRYLGNWAIYGFAFALFVRSLGFEGSYLGLAAAFSGAYVLGYAAVFAPAGLGVREGVLIAFLRPEYGVAAVGIALLARLWMTVVELAPAGALGLWEVFRDDRRRDVRGVGDKGVTG